MPRFDVTQPLAETIKTIRIQNKISSKDLAKKIGKSPSYLSKLEKAEIKSIDAQGGNWGCSIEVSGTGTLTVNKNREAENAIRIYGKCISNSLKVKEGVVLKVYKKNDENPSIQIEGKNKNSISVSGISNTAYKVEGPWEQHENVPVIVPATCMESNYVEFEGDTAQYAVVRNGDGYDVFRKTDDFHLQPFLFDFEKSIF